MTTSPKTLAQHLTRTVGRNLICAALLIGAFLSMRALVGDSYMDYAHPEPAQVDAGETRVDNLIAKHHCWTGEAPAEMRGVIPGHVVVSTATTTRLGGARAVGMALEQIFDGVDHGLTVHAFCK